MKAPCPQSEQTSDFSRNLLDKHDPDDALDMLFRGHSIVCGLALQAVSRVPALLLLQA